MKLAIVLISSVIGIIQSLNLKMKKNANSTKVDYSQSLLTQINFSPGSELSDLIFVSRVHATLLYETWEVLKQMPHGKKPFLAHIFKYTLGSNFPLKPDSLNNFCGKIETYNQKMKTANMDIRALSCVNSTAFNQKIQGGIVTYLLFEKPIEGERLADICQPNCAKDRICRYRMKDFIKGWMESVMYSQTSADKFDVNFLLAQNGLFYGRLPGINKKSAQDSNKHFITLAFPKPSSPEALSEENSNDKDSKAQKIKAVKEKQMMVHIGKFLINMYKGLDNSTDTPPPSSEDSFNPTGLNFQNLTDVFLNLNKDKQGNLTHLHPDDYFGVTPVYISSVQEFTSQTLATPKVFKAMDQFLAGTFYEFIFKLVEFDLDNKKQFENFKAVLDHPFLKKTQELQHMKSDTAHDARR